MPPTLCEPYTYPSAIARCRRPYMSLAWPTSWPFSTSITCSGPLMPDTNSHLPSGVKTVPRSRLPELVVRPQLLTDCDGPQMMPVLYVRSRYVDQSDGVVAPMRHGYPSVVGRCGNHFGQRAGLEHAYYRIRAGVYDGHGRRILGVYVERAPIKRDPQVSAVVTQSAFHRFADKFPSVAVVIMGKSLVT